MRQFELSLEYLTDAYLRRTKTLGPDHLDTIRTERHLYEAMFDKGNLGDALHDYEHRLVHQQKVFGFKHEDILRTQLRIGLMLSIQHNYLEAFPCFEKALPHFIE